MDSASLHPWQIQALETADAVYRAGYNAGFQAAFAQIMQAAKAGLGSATEQSLSGIPPLQNSQSQLPQMNAAQPARAARGSVKNIVRNFVLSASGPVTEHQLGTLHPEINRSSRYMAFRNLASEGVIAKRGDAWVPAPTGEGNPGGSTPG